MENLNFIALDFETANSSRLSACSIGLVKVKNGKIIDEYYSLIKPSPFIFDFRNTQIHGITENDCVIAPSFLDIWPSISLWFQNQNIVGHWVSFERSVLGELSIEYNIDFHIRNLYDTWKTSKELLPGLKNYKLPTVYSYLFNREFNHHNALEDARASAEIMISLYSLKGKSSSNIIFPNSFSSVNSSKNENVNSLTSKYDPLIKDNLAYNVYQFQNKDYYSQIPLNTEEKISYVGEFKASLKHGNGTLTFPDGRTYTGDFEDNKFHGKGTFTFPDGRTYIGDFEDDKFQGKGTYTFPDGRTYIGDFKNSLKNGKGKLTFPDGRTYIGDFEYDKCHGKGTYTFPDGENYVGDFLFGKYYGRGTFTFNDGTIFIGEFRNGLKNGLGTYTFLNGITYVIEYQNGLIKGLGTYYFPHSKIYVGELRESTLKDYNNLNVSSELNPFEKIIKLNELKIQGIISHAEFLILRKKYLSEL